MSAPEPRNRAALFVFLALLAGVGYLVARMAAPYLLALFLGATLAALAQPLYRAALRVRLGPRLASAAVTLAVLLLLIAPAALFTAQAVRQAVSLGQELSERQDLSLGRALEAIDRFPSLQRWTGDRKAIKEQVVSGVRRSAGVITALVLRLAKGVPEILLQLALTVLSLYFFLLDGPRFADWLLSRSALDADVRERMLRSLHGTAIATVWASLAAAGSHGLVLFLAYLIFGIPAAFVAGGAAFILSWIPMVGTIPVSLAGIGYLYAQGSTGKMIGMIGAMLLAGVSDNIVRPLVLRGHEGMHPFVALLAILGGIAVFGVFGVFIGPIVTALFISLVDLWPTLAARAR